jgi:hypothetical protein
MLQEDGGMAGKTKGRRKEKEIEIVLKENGHWTGKM